MGFQSQVNSILNQAIGGAMVKGIKDTSGNLENVKQAVEDVNKTIDQKVTGLSDSEFENSLKLGYNLNDSLQMLKAIENDKYAKGLFANDEELDKKLNAVESEQMKLILILAYLILKKKLCIDLHTKYIRKTTMKILPIMQ